MIKNVVPMLLLAALALMLSGCWDYTEIELLDFVFGAGIEQVEPDFVVFTEMVKTNGAGESSEFTPVILSTKSQSLSSAGRALSNPAGMGVFWPHAHVTIVNEEVAKQGILPAIEYVVKSRHMRSTVYVFVTKDCTVEEVFKSKPPLVTSVSEHLDGIVSLQALLSDFYPQQIWEFIADLTATGISGTLPTVQLVNEAGDMVPIVEGTAVFKLDRMVGWLDGDESQLFSLLKGAFRRGQFTMETKIDGKLYPISYEIVANQVEIKPKVNGQEPKIEIKLDLRLNVTEVGAAPLNLRDPAEESQIEEQISHAFNRRVRDLLRKIQYEFNSDILGFGQLLRRKEPEVWRRLADNWDRKFPELDVDVSVISKIVTSALSPQPIIVRD